jgi:hypothetical protein
MRKEEILVMATMEEEMNQIQNQIQNQILILILD